jgi:hypothetical protein
MPEETPGIAAVMNVKLYSLFRKGWQFLTKIKHLYGLENPLLSIYTVVMNACVYIDFYIKFYSIIIHD